MRSNIILVAALIVTACGGATSTAPSAGLLPQGSEPVVLDPADFVALIDHPYWPMTPGSHWVYREIGPGGGELQVDITVLAETKVILGITVTVIHDVVSRDGELIEDTFDWYAQDTAGNLWYLGEDTKEYRDGVVVSTGGSWQAGVDGAQAGIILPAEPRVGMTYRQEYYAGKAEDAAEILSLTERVEGPFGSFTDVLMTKDFTPLSPNLVEHKFYAKGIGVVLVFDVSGGTDREELVTFEPGR